MVAVAAANVPFQRLDVKKKSSPQSHRRFNKPTSSSNKSVLRGIIVNKKGRGFVFVFVDTVLRRIRGLV